MEHMEENKNKIENNEIVKPIIETSEKKISPEEFSDFLDSEKTSFKEETEEERKNLNSIGLDEPSFEQAKVEIGVEVDLQGVDKEVEDIVVEAKKEWRFNLEKPEGFYKNKIKRVGREDSLEEDTPFDLLGKTGQKIGKDETGREQMIRYVDYEISPNLNLRVQGSEYTYTENDKNSKSYIKAYYQKDKNELYKMSFESGNPIFAGKAILDMMKRIPVGTEMFKGETSLSTDSFPLLLNAFTKYSEKDPGSLEAEQIGEIFLNEAGKFSKVSKESTQEDQVKLLNEKIKDFSQKMKVELSEARISLDEDGKIVVPKILIKKNR
jgi:hypothetical protein